MTITPNQDRVVQNMKMFTIKMTKISNELQSPCNKRTVLASLKTNKCIHFDSQGNNKADEHSWKELV